MSTPFGISDYLRGTRHRAGNRQSSIQLMAGMDRIGERMACAGANATGSALPCAILPTTSICSTISALRGNRRWSEADRPFWD